VLAGKRSATAHDKPMARVMNALLTIFDDTDDAAALIWMPAHKGDADVGRSALSDGSTLTRVDLDTNAKADALAKVAARSRRAAPAARAAHVAGLVLTRRLARHVGRMTHAANHVGEPPLRGWQPVPVGATSSPPRRRLDDRPPNLGGHVLVPMDQGGWVCTICRRSAKYRANIASKKCQGNVLRRWARREAAWRSGGADAHTTHSLRMTGDIIWCASCAAYGTVRVVDLAAPCKGPPRGGRSGAGTRR
jgi:hypothetical protein